MHHYFLVCCLRRRTSWRRRSLHRSWHNAGADLRVLHCPCLIFLMACCWAAFTIEKIHHWLAVWPSRRRLKATFPTARPHLLLESSPAGGGQLRCRCGGGGGRRRHSLPSMSSSEYRDRPLFLMRRRRPILMRTRRQLQRRRRSGRARRWRTCRGATRPQRSTLWRSWASRRRRRTREPPQHAEQDILVDASLEASCGLAVRERDQMRRSSLGLPAHLSFTATAERVLHSRVTFILPKFPTESRTLRKCAGLLAMGRLASATRRRRTRPGTCRRRQRRKARPLDRPSS